MSFVEEAIWILSDEHALDLEGGVDHPKKVEGPCRIASGIETTFVSAFCDYIRTSINLEIPFHKYFYIPSRPAESLVGYDLSIGRYETQRRIRTMHKVVYETWCDQEWEWSLANRRPRPTSDYSHFITLLRQYKNHPNLIPYLVLHVCYCIHDYRRMGKEYEGWQIPPFSSILRTVIISLPNLCEQLEGWEQAINQDGFRISIRKQVLEKDDNETIHEYLIRISQKNNYSVIIQPGDLLLDDCILTFDEFCEEIIDQENG